MNAREVLLAHYRRLDAETPLEVDAGFGGRWVSQYPDAVRRLESDEPVVASAGVLFAAHIARPTDAQFFEVAADGTLTPCDEPQDRLPLPVGPMYVHPDALQ